MNTKIFGKIAMFVFGAAVGSVVTWKLVEEKYKQISDEEIESVKEAYDRAYGKLDNDRMDMEQDEDDVDSEENAKSEYDRIIGHCGYGAESSASDKNQNGTKKDDEEEDDEDVSEPYTISYDDFDDNGYQTETLYYYDDGVLENSITGAVIEDIDGTIGSKSIEELKDSGEDYIYVRNDNLGIDYEILRDRRKYSEVN